MEATAAACSSAAAAVADPGMKVEAVAVVGEAPDEVQGTQGHGHGQIWRSNQQNVVYMGGGGGGGGGGLKKARRDRGGCTAKERISKMTPCVAGKRSSIYRGVTRHRWTGRYEAHLWDKSTWNQNQNKKGKQVYLGAYDDEEAAARAYDLAALKYWGAGTLINFPVSDYSRDLDEMQMVSKEDYLVSLRRKSSAFSRGFPKYRGLSRQLQSSQWDGSFNQFHGTNKGSAVEREYGSSFCLERKIDLTNFIRWWGPSKIHQPETYSHGTAEDIGRELRKFECHQEPTRPYQLPSLGIHHRIKPHVTACGILSQSVAFKNLLHKSSEVLEDIPHTEIGHGKTTSTLIRVGGAGIERPGTTPLFSEFPLQRDTYPRAPLLSAPLGTTWNPIDPLPDPIFWTSLVPAGPSITGTLRKAQTNSTDTFNYQQ